MTSVILATNGNSNNNNSNNGNNDEDECVSNCSEDDEENDNGNSGSIWTTKNDCGIEQQDVNQYVIGEKVYINGKNFKPNHEYEWEIEGLGGSENSNASCDPDEEVAEGEYTTDGSGNFCFEAYTIANDDCGEYKVGFDNKHDNYRVDLNAPVVPEFGLVVGTLTILSALGIFFFVRKN